MKESRAALIIEDLKNLDERLMAYEELIPRYMKRLRETISTVYDREWNQIWSQWHDAMKNIVTEFGPLDKYYSEKLDSIMSGLGDNLERLYSKFEKDIENAIDKYEQEVRMKLTGDVRKASMGQRIKHFFTGRRPSVKFDFSDIPSDLHRNIRTAKININNIVQEGTNRILSQASRLKPASDPRVVDLLSTFSSIMTYGTNTLTSQRGELLNKTTSEVVELYRHTLEMRLNKLKASGL